MPTLVHPLVAWSTAEDMSTWNVSNVSRTAGQADPFGGTSAYLMDDTSSGAEAYVSSPNVLTTSWSTNNPTTVSLYLKAGSAAVTNVGLYDVTNSTYRSDVLVTWSGGVPTCTNATGSATLLTPIAVGGGWYLIEFIVQTTNGGNHALILHPAGIASNTPTGTVVVYVRPTALLDVLDDVLVWDEPRPGYDTVQSASGVEDAWWVGTDHHLQATVRGIPARATDTPARISGWDGIAQAKWMNQGIAAMLIAGMQKDTLVFAPSRAAVTSDSATACYLVDAATPTLEPNGLRSVPFHLRTVAAFGFEAVQA